MPENTTFGGDYSRLEAVYVQSKKAIANRASPFETKERYPNQYRGSGFS
jgi:hypothetical protein